jgi:hypothetical protein
MMRLTAWVYFFGLFIGLPCSFRLLQHLLSFYQLCLYGRIAPTVSKVLEATRERATLLYWQKLQRKPESERALMDSITHAPEMDLPASLNEVAAY